MKASASDEKIESPTSGSVGSRGSGGQFVTASTTTPTKKMNFNHNVNNLSPKPSNENTNLDMSNPKCESISSNEKEIEYLRVIFPHNPRNNSFQSTINNHELNVDYNEIVKLIEDDTEGLDCDKSYIKVFNSRGVTGMIPSSCVEPILDHQLNNFIFIRHPTNVGHFANSDWYFGNISRFDSILLLNRYASSGDFLVRDSEVSFI